MQAWYYQLRLFFLFTIIMILISQLLHLVDQLGMLIRLLPHPCWMYFVRTDPSSVCPQCACVCVQGILPFSLCLGIDSRSILFRLYLDMACSRSLNNHDDDEVMTLQWCWHAQAFFFFWHAGSPLHYTWPTLVFCGRTYLYINYIYVACSSFN